MEFSIWDPASWIEAIKTSVTQAFEVLLGWISDALADFLLVNVLPYFPDLSGINLSQYTGQGGVFEVVEAFFPLKDLGVALAAYLGWWVAWSLFRIIAKLIWSG